MLFHDANRYLIVSTAISWSWGKRISQPDYPTKIWSLASGKLVATFAGHTGGISDAQLTSDGGRLITASDDKSARIWSLNLIGNGLKLGERDDVINLKIARQASVFVALDSRGIVEVRNSTTGKAYSSFPLGKFSYDVALDSNGKRLAVLGAANASIWNLETALEIDTFPTVEPLPPRPCTGNCRDLFSLALSNDGLQFAIAGWGKAWLKTVDPNSHALTLPLPGRFADQPIDVLAFPPLPGRLLVLSRATDTVAVLVLIELARVAVHDGLKQSARFRRR